MSEFNPTELIGNNIAKVVGPGSSPLPFSAQNLPNQAQTILQGTQAIVAQTLVNTADRAFQLKQKISPTKKLVTFHLEDQDGFLAIPDSDFDLGYTFSMAINPSSLKIAYPAKTVNPVRTMGGWVLQHWYPELGTLTGDGIVGNLQQRWNDDIKASPRWAQFKKLIAVYQNNSIAYTPNQLNRNSSSFNPTAVCTYDSVTYKGYFENFGFGEEQDQPYTRKYDFSFKFLEMIETENITELTKFTSKASTISGQVGKALGSATGIVSKFT